MKIFLCVGAQLCPGLGDSMDWSLSGSFVHGIFQARILESVAISHSRDLHNPGIKIVFLASPSLAGGFFTTALLGKPQKIILLFMKPAGSRDLLSRSWKTFFLTIYLSDLQTGFIFC